MKSQSFSRELARGFDRFARFFTDVVAINYQCSLLIVTGFHHVCAVAASKQVAPEAAAAVTVESRALCEAVQPFLGMLNDQEKLLGDPSQLQIADRAVRTATNVWR